MLEPILSRYSRSCQPTSVQALGNAGGFSGARIWKLETPSGELCVRRWPRPHPSVETLAWIHRVLGHAHEQGCRFVPVPLVNDHGRTFVESDGHLWEVTAWMPGIARLTDGRVEALVEAIRCLARFHCATANLQTTVGTSQGLQERLRFATDMLNGELERWNQQLAKRESIGFTLQCGEIVRLAAPLIEPLHKLLKDKVSTDFTLQPCIRDIWHDHVLFEGTRVTGLIDFGGMRMETVAGDVARLLGSVSSRIPEAWAVGLEAYSEIRRLSEVEREATLWFWQANLALSGLNWVRWLMFEGRTFDDLPAVGRRLEEILKALRDYA